MNNTIIIPGMYRSGTSHIVKAIEKAGAHLGWTDEHGECPEIHGWLLCENSNNQPDPSSCPYGYKPSLDFTNRLRALKEDNAHYPIVAYKDPLMSSLFLAFVDVWPEAKYVLCVRNPLSAIWSQRKRGNISDAAPDTDALGHHSQLITNVLAVANIRNVSLHLFNYDGDPQREQDTLREFLDLPCLDILSEWRHATASRL